MRRENRATGPRPLGAKDSQRRAPRPTAGAGAASLLGSKTVALAFRRSLVPLPREDKATSVGGGFGSCLKRMLRRDPGVGGPRDLGGAVHAWEPRGVPLALRSRRDRRTSKVWRRRAS